MTRGRRHLPHVKKFAEEISNRISTEGKVLVHLSKITEHGKQRASERGFLIPDTILLTGESLLGAADCITPASRGD